MKKKSWIISVLCAVVALVCAPASAMAQDDDDPLDQVVSADEHFAPEGEKATVTEGHIDLAPLVIDGSVKLFMRQDSEEDPVWRDLSDVTFVLGESAQLTLPEGNTYDFTGASSGDTTWAIGQSQEAGVPWVGWNTQHPSLIATAARGVTLEFDGHQGPGDVSVFLQSNGFSAPQVLWSSVDNAVGKGVKGASDASPQTMWVDMHTHTHANWVFTEPGTHLLKFTARVTLPDGTEQASSAIMRFAVGESADAAASTQWEGNTQPPAVAQETQENSLSPSSEETAHAVSPTTLYAVIFLVIIVIIVVGAYVFSRRSRALQKRADAQVGEKNSRTHSPENNEEGE